MVCPHSHIEMFARLGLSPGGYMQEREVIDFYRAMEQSDITVWIDGGWGVDALLGRQTRVHSDLDIAIQQEDAANIRALLESQGYRC